MAAFVITLGAHKAISAAAAGRRAANAAATAANSPPPPAPRRTFPSGGHGGHGGALLVHEGFPSPEAVRALSWTGEGHLWSYPRRNRTSWLMLAGRRPRAPFCDRDCRLPCQLTEMAKV